MSDTVKLQSEKLQAVKGLVEQVNRHGIKIGGTWYDYDRSFEGERPGKDLVGQEVDLALVDSKSGKQFIRAFEICGEIMGDPEGQDEPAPEAAQESAAEGPSPSDDPATPQQVEYVETLLEKAGLAQDDLAQLSQIRFKKAFADLTKREASRTITYLGGGDFPGRARQARQQ
jgi:hypothetical protein